MALFFLFVVFGLVPDWKQISRCSRAPHTLTFYGTQRAFCPAHRPWRLPTSSIYEQPNHFLTLKFYLPEARLKMKWVSWYFAIGQFWFGIKWPVPDQTSTGTDQYGPYCTGTELASSVSPYPDFEYICQILMVSKSFYLTLTTTNWNSYVEHSSDLSDFR